FAFRSALPRNADSGGAPPRLFPISSSCTLMSLLCPWHRSTPLAGRDSPDVRGVATADGTRWWRHFSSASAGIDFPVADYAASDWAAPIERRAATSLTVATSAKAKLSVAQVMR